MEKLTLVIGNKNYSSWSMRPWVLLKHFKIPFDEIFIPLGKPESKQNILKHSPAGKVPILKHGKLVVWESLAIAEYAAEIFPEKNLWPEDKEARAVARAVSSEMHAGFMSLRKTCPMNVRANKPLAELTPEVKADVARLSALWEDCRKRFGQGGDFLFGTFSIADAMYAPVIWRIKTYALPISGAAQKYCAAMLDLPAMKEWQKAAVEEPQAIP
ncbi:MAG: glutathione S-transferase [Omnitrophica WOR_2 bacterium RIFCSPHIGHO2_01_FULL_48_9]|nr:MAG: glutathione S-transferase [Omnitrophica WOR_2 bacterium RIFCSPHIGHO2_02_FULL_48_11]OGX34124.1 MAG: glutathione S-transferase [Omnitrophica WOR_2 bacterium RIFCSPHIGHO2_01_FULL_48_9]